MGMRCLAGKPCREEQGRRSGFRHLSHLSLAVVLLATLAVPARASVTELVSVSSDGTPGQGHSMAPSISADGRYVAFESSAGNLVANDMNQTADILVRDRWTGEVERASIATDGSEGDSQSTDAAISADGGCVAFMSHASNLVAGDTNEESDVFIRDRSTGQTERVSVASDGTQGDGPSFHPAISADGRYVTFISEATNLVSGDTNGRADCFVHDRESGQTERVSVASDGTQGNADTFSTSPISGDGRYVAFASGADNLVPGDTNQSLDVFVRDRLASKTERVSVASDGEQGNETSDEPSMSYDGRYVAFTSGARNLIEGDANWRWDIFVHDRATGATTLVSVAAGGAQANDPSGSPAISPDGGHVAFYSYATNLVADDTNIYPDAFVHDRDTGETVRVNVASDGTESNNTMKLEGGVSISSEGRCVAFCSSASNLVPGYADGWWNVFVHDRRGFGDVPAAHWAYDEVMACVDAGVVGGYDDGLYHPELQVTRDQMAVYIARALVSPSGDAAIPEPVPPPSFPDVPATDWAYRHIEYAVSQSVVQGYGDGTYGPGIALDRGQMAVFIARAMVAPGGDAAVPDPLPPATFPDVASTFWAYKHVEYCVGEEVVKGYDDGKYHPDYPCTRDQMAVYIARAFGLM